MCGSVISPDTIENISMDSLTKWDAADGFQLVFALFGIALGYLSVRAARKFSNYQGASRPARVILLFETVFWGVLGAFCLLIAHGIPVLLKC